MKTRFFAVFVSLGMAACGGGFGESRRLDVPDYVTEQESDKPDTKACNDGNAEACHKVAKRVRNGAFRNLMYEKGCHYGHMESCRQVGWFLERSNHYRFHEDNLKDSAKYYKKACGAGIIDACNQLSYVSRHTKNDKDRAWAQKQIGLRCSSADPPVGCPSK